MAESLFGTACLIVGLAVLSTIPIVQFLSLGYLLEVSGRVARTGRLRDGFIGIRKAAHVGGLVLGAWLIQFPLRLVSAAWYDAQLLDPGGVLAVRWRTALVVLTFAAVGHIYFAWYAGGRLRHYFWPALFPYFLLRSALMRTPVRDWFPPARLWYDLCRGQVLARSRDAVWDYVMSFRLPYYFWLGVRGFAGALLWLLVPVGLLIGGTSLPPGPAVLTGWLGALLLCLVALYLPFLQTHFAMEGKFRAMFQVGRVRQMYRRAPVAFWSALLITLLFAIPLYVLEIELTQQQVTWIASVVFVSFIFPARLLAGWAVARARRRQQPRHFVFRWFFRLMAVPVVAAYVLVIFLSQYLNWYGSLSMLEQHAFMLPVPFLAF